MNEIHFASIVQVKGGMYKRKAMFQLPKVDNSVQYR